MKFSDALDALAFELCSVSRGIDVQNVIVHLKLDLLDGLLGMSADSNLDVDLCVVRPHRTVSWSHPPRHLYLSTCGTTAGSPVSVSAVRG